jgi:hypothetical protein
MILEMNEEDLRHIIGKLTSYLDTHYEIHTVLENTEEFTEEEIAIMSKEKAEYDFWHKMTTKQEVTYVFDIESNNPCCEIMMK